MNMRDFLGILQDYSAGGAFLRLNIMARNDDLVPCAQSAPFNDLISSTDRKSIIAPAGHIGLAVGSKAQHEVWPQACDWLAERS